MIALLLFPLKILERMVNGAPTFTAIREGIWNRSDDPSLWALFASSIAVMLIARATRITFRSPGAVCERPGWGTYWLIWPIISAFAASIYLLYVFDQKETFFFCLKPPESRGTVFGTPLGVATESIQLLEGLMILSHIILIGAILPILVNVVETLVGMARSRPGLRMSRHWRRAAGLCVSVAAAPFIATVICFSVTTIVLFIGGTRNFLGLSDYKKLILTLVLYAVF
jgi:hypothetical protein